MDALDLLGVEQFGGRVREPGLCEGALFGEPGRRRGCGSTAATPASPILCLCAHDSPERCRNSRYERSGDYIDLAAVARRAQLAVRRAAVGAWQGARVVRDRHFDLWRERIGATDSGRSGDHTPTRAAHRSIPSADGRFGGRRRVRTVGVRSGRGAADRVRGGVSARSRSTARRQARLISPFVHISIRGDVPSGVGGVDRHRPAQAARRVGGPVLWTVPSGNRIVSSRCDPRNTSHPPSWILVW